MMRVAVPVAGQGVAGDSFHPLHLLHGQMHYDMPNQIVIFTDTWFSPNELALPGVVVLDGTSMETATSVKPEEKPKAPVAPGPTKAATRGGKSGRTP